MRFAAMRSRLSYANVCASLALFMALGGTGYAAVAIPRNSIGSAQIRNRAVGTSELKSRSVSSSKIRSGAVGLRAMSASAKASLRGQTGPAGPQGPAGPSGLTLRAAVPAGGTVARGNAVRAAHAGGTNLYDVQFDRDVSTCVATATLATVGGADPPPGRVTLGQSPTGVVVRTFDAAGAPAEESFNLTLAC